MHCAQTLPSPWGYMALGLAQVRAFSPNSDLKPMCETVSFCVPPSMSWCVYA